MSRRQSGSYASSPVSASPIHRGSRKPSAALVEDDDEGLVMREKDREGQNGSIGKSGGVDVGVTRPKRRLSSLPSLPHPFLGSSPSNSHRAMSNAAASPPISPGGLISQVYPQSTYQALHHQLAGVTSTAYNRTQHPRSAEPRVDDKPLYSTSNTTMSAAPSGPPRIWGIELKWISLLTLALQNAFLTIIMHYSRITTAPNKTYSAAAAVLLNELLKGSVSIIIALRKIDVDMANMPLSSWTEKDSRHLTRPTSKILPSYLHSSRIKNLSGQVFSSDCYKLAVPAVLYVIQNNLQYVAATNLDVATFQVTYQMKILTTAFFSVLLLRKRLSRSKWAALILLAIGVGIVQIQSTGTQNGHMAKGADGGSTPTESIMSSERVMHPLRGFIAVTMACLTSGLAGVYFEFILKSSNSGPNAKPPPDLWVRNTQLSFFSLLPALVPILFGGNEGKGGSWISGVIGKFSNFNGWAMGTVLTQTFGGLITAVVIRYSDNIMKGFATSLSIIISFLASVALFSYPITLAFVVGSSIVLAATFMYNAPAPSPSSTSTRTAVGVAPGSPIPTSAPILGEPEPPSRASSVINLLRLGGSSANSSRKPSATDLRSMGNNNGQLSFTSIPSTPGNSSGYYSVSAPGTPYLSHSNSVSGLNGMSDYTNGHQYGGKISPLPPPRKSSPFDNKARPTLAVDTSR